MRWASAIVTDLLDGELAGGQLALGVIKSLVVLRLCRLQLAAVLDQRLGLGLHLADVQPCHCEVLLDLLGTHLDAAWLLLQLRHVQLPVTQASTNSVLTATVIILITMIVMRAFI